MNSPKGRHFSLVYALLNSGTKTGRGKSTGGNGKSDKTERVLPLQSRPRRRGEEKTKVAGYGTADRRNGRRDRRTQRGDRKARDRGRLSAHAGKMRPP